MIDKILIVLSILFLAAGVGLIVWGGSFALVDHELTHGLTIALFGVTVCGHSLTMLLMLREMHLSTLRVMHLDEARRQALLAFRT